MILLCAVQVWKEKETKEEGEWSDRERRWLVLDSTVDHRESISFSVANLNPLNRGWSVESMRELIPRKGRDPELKG